MPKRYDLYGFSEMRLELVSEALASVMNVVFERRDSSYRGGEYFRHASASGDELLVQANYDESSGDWAEDVFQQHQTLLYATTGVEDDKVEKAIGPLGGQLLRRQVL